MNLDSILALIFQGARRMPGKDQRVNLYMIRAELDVKIGEAIDDLNRIKSAQGEFEEGKRYGHLDS